MPSELLDTASGQAAAPALRRQAFADRPVEELDRALKYVLPAGRAAAAAAWLRAICRPDPEFHDATVWTVYYDTPNALSLGEKFDSDYLKTKLRVRWYGSPHGADSGPAFVEAKSRVGTRREKTRVRLELPAAEIRALSLDDPRYLAFPRALAPSGVLFGPGWRPVLRLRYRRTRFIDAVTGSRVSLDQDISAEAISSRHASSLNLGPLDLAVLEIKGAEDALPRSLMPLLNLGARQGALSKYAAVYQHVRRLS
jgi:hypothetical protein